MPDMINIPATRGIYSGSHSIWMMSYFI